MNLFLLLAMFGSTCYVYYKLKKFFCLISIFMDSEILDQFTNLERNVNSEVTKSKRGRKKKIDPKINEVEENDVRERRERLVACVLSGNSKQYSGKEYTGQQINELDCNNVNTLLNRYQSVLNVQMTKSLGKSVITFYSNVACSLLGDGNQQDSSNDLECDPFLNTAIAKIYMRFVLSLRCFSSSCFSGIITGKHYTKNSVTKFNDNGNCDPATRNCKKTEEPSEN